MSHNRGHFDGFRIVTEMFVPDDILQSGKIGQGEPMYRFAAKYQSRYINYYCDVTN